MPSLLTEDEGGTRYLRAGAIPVVVAAIAVPVVVAMLISVVAIEATAVGMAAGAAAVATLLIVAARVRPRGRLEVAARTDAGRRLLVVAAEEIPAAVAERVAERAGGAEDVRLVVPLRSRRIDRWLSAEDRARGEAQRRLAHSAGVLVAAGLPVSGSLGDGDLVQAVEDELRSFAADEVVVVSADREKVEQVRGRLAVPLVHIRSAQ
jgi:hypothetical protein